MDRRSLLLGIGASLIVAPAIVRASSLMHIRPMSLNIIRPKWIAVYAFYAEDLEGNWVRHEIPLTGELLNGHS